MHSVTRWCRLLAGFVPVVLGVFAAPRTAVARGQSSVATLRAAAVSEEELPTVDGQVIERVWSRVDPYTDFIQQDPNEGAPATERTEVRVIFDQRSLYIAIICFDTEPSNIVVTQSRRDADLNDTDSVQVVLDTYGDRQNGFVFGTNPLGIEYDGQVSGEGQMGGAVERGGDRGSQRGTISSYNPNWDADWTVKSAITSRGWETELAIPFKTLRYEPGSRKTWGFNVMRNIRRKNEQVFLAPIPRGYNLHRVSLAASLTGLELPRRREIRAVPFVLGASGVDYSIPGSRMDHTGDVGLDVKWGVRPNLTADFTVNTDFAQVEADEQQVNLTRFPLFFPEKRGFFLENASLFQFGTPQSVDLFFSRRVGLSAAGIPIGIVAGARLSGKVGQYQVGVLNMQTQKTTQGSALVAPGHNFSVARIRREFGRSNVGAIFVNRQTTSDAPGSPYNRAYGIDANLQITSNTKLITYFARTDSGRAADSDYAGRIHYQYNRDPLVLNFGYTQVGERFDPEVGFVPRRGYRRPEVRVDFSPQPKRWRWIRRFAPHGSWNAEYGFDGRLQSSSGHYHFFEIQPASGGRFGWSLNQRHDRPDRPFTVYAAPDGRTVVIAPALYEWFQHRLEYFGDPSAPFFGNIRFNVGRFYNGAFNEVQLELNGRLGATLVASVGYNRQNIDLPTGRFSIDLIPVKASYSFTTLASIQALIQYNSQNAQLSSNIRFAMLNRSGTGLFIVYNDRQDLSSFTAIETLGRSFIVKYTRLLDF